MHAGRALNRKIVLINSELDEALPVLSLLRVKTSHTEQNAEQSAKRWAYRFRLHKGQGGSTYLTDESSLSDSRTSLSESYGDRLVLVAKA